MTRHHFLSSLVLGMALSSSALAASMAELKARGSLRVIAAEGEQPEEFSFKAGAAPGFEREMLEGFAKLHRLKFEVVAVKGWDERIPTLLRGEGDVIVALTDTEERRKQVSFTAETIETRHLVVSHKPHAPVASLEEFRKERVGVIKATSWADAAVEAGVPSARIESFGDLDTLLDALKSGRIGATVMSVSDFTLAARRTPGLEAGIFVGPLRHQAWAVRKEDKELMEAMNAYIGNLRKSSSWNRLVIKYFGAQALTVLGRAHEQ
jgi:polar amino acid transport system substrate-binding protein